MTFTVFGMFSALVPGFVSGTLHQRSLLVAGAIAASGFLASAAAQLIGSRVYAGRAAPVVGLGLLGQVVSAPALMTVFAAVAAAALTASVAALVRANRILVEADS